MDNIAHIKTLKDLEELSDRCVAAAKDVVIDNVKSDLDVEVMMRYGLFPAKTFNVNDIDRLTMDPTTYKFWHGGLDPYNEREHLFINQRWKNNTTWYYSTLETHKKNGVQKAISLPLMYLAPHLVYNGSKRPKTDMDLFRSPVSTVISTDKIINNQITLNGEVWNCIPVSRYGQGMSKGMYHTEEDEEFTEEQFCGTFYYYEPESTTFLAYKTSRTYFNKSDALDKLGQEFDDELIGYIDGFLQMHMNGEIPPDLKLTPKEYIRIFEDKEQFYTPTVSDTPHYLANILNLYAIEDEHDQTLCNAGREHDIDIIILTHMIGSNQIVTEVLDTRSRVDSFRSLIYTNIL